MIYRYPMGLHNVNCTQYEESTKSITRQHKSQLITRPSYHLLETYGIQLGIWVLSANARMRIWFLAQIRNSDHDTSGWGSCNVRSMEEKNKSLMSLKVTYMPRRFPSGWCRVYLHRYRVYGGTGV